MFVSRDDHYVMMLGRDVQSARLLDTPVVTIPLNAVVELVPRTILPAPTILPPLRCC